MKQYKIIWEIEAFNVFETIIKWYRINMSYQTADKFRKGILNTIQLLSTDPYLGIIEKDLSREDIVYRSLLSHPHYRIVYYLMMIKYLLFIYGTIE